MAGEFLNLHLQVGSSRALPNGSSFTPQRGDMETLMKIATPVILLAAALAVASPALAKTSLSKGTSLCKAELAKSSPQSARVDDDETRSNENTLFLTFKVKKADGVSTTYACAVDRASQKVELTEK